VSPGSEPERDDTGLPPVDIEIPDDARDLDRDVLAYRRELRAVRRQQRRNRWHRSLSRDGIVLPLLACCLILALITGTLLTVFTATSDQGLSGPPATGANSAPATGRGAAAPPAGPGPHIGPAGLLPRAVVITDDGVPIPVDELSRAMLVIVPPGCACRSTLDWLGSVAVKASATAYLVYSSHTRAEVERLYGQLDKEGQSALIPADDAGNVLTSRASFPVGMPATQLTAILVSPDRIVHYANGLSPTDSRAALIQELIT
jgi:hypothetical protein